MPSQGRYHRNIFRERKRYQSALLQRSDLDQPTYIVDADFRDWADIIMRQNQRSMQTLSDVVDEGGLVQPNLNADSDSFLLLEMPADAQAADRDRNFLISGARDRDNYDRGSPEHCSVAYAGGLRCTLFEDTDFRCVIRGGGFAEELADGIHRKFTDVQGTTLTDNRAAWTKNFFTDMDPKAKVRLWNGEYTIQSNTETTLTLSASPNEDASMPIPSGDRYYYIGIVEAAAAARVGVYLDVHLEDWGVDEDPELDHNPGGTPVEAMRRTKLIQQVWLDFEDSLNRAPQPLVDYTDYGGVRHYVRRIGEIGVVPVGDDHLVQDDDANGAGIVDDRQDSLGSGGESSYYKNLCFSSATVGGRAPSVVGDEDQRQELRTTRAIDDVSNLEKDVAFFFRDGQSNSTLTVQPNTLSDRLKRDRSVAVVGSSIDYGKYLETAATWVPGNDDHTKHRAKSGMYMEAQGLQAALLCPHVHTVYVSAGAYIIRDIKWTGPTSKEESQFDARTAGDSKGYLHIPAHKKVILEAGAVLDCTPGFVHTWEVVDDVATPKTDSLYVETPYVYLSGDLDGGMIRRVYDWDDPVVYATRFNDNTSVRAVVYVRGGSIRECDIGLYSPLVDTNGNVFEHVGPRGVAILIESGGTGLISTYGSSVAGQPSGTEQERHDSADYYDELTYRDSGDRSAAKIIDCSIRTENCCAIAAYGPVVQSEAFKGKAYFSREVQPIEISGNTILVKKIDLELPAVNLVGGDIIFKDNVVGDGLGCQVLVGRGSDLIVPNWPVGNAATHADAFNMRGGELSGTDANKLLNTNRFRDTYTISGNKIFGTVVKNWANVSSKQIYTANSRTVSGALRKSTPPDRASATVRIEGASTVNFTDNFIGYRYDSDEIRPYLGDQFIGLYISPAHCAGISACTVSNNVIEQSLKGIEINGTWAYPTSISIRDNDVIETCGYIEYKDHVLVPGQFAPENVTIEPTGAIYKVGISVYKSANRFLASSRSEVLDTIEGLPNYPGNVSICGNFCRVRSQRMAFGIQAGRGNVEIRGNVVHMSKQYAETVPITAMAEGELTGLVVQGAEDNAAYNSNTDPTALYGSIGIFTFGRDSGVTDHTAYPGGAGLADQVGITFAAENEMPSVTNNHVLGATYGIFLGGFDEYNSDPYNFKDKVAPGNAWSRVTDVKGSVCDSNLVRESDYGIVARQDDPVISGNKIKRCLYNGIMSLGGFSSEENANLGRPRTVGGLIENNVVIECGLRAREILLARSGRDYANTSAGARNYAAIRRIGLVPYINSGVEAASAAVTGLMREESQGFLLCSILSNGGTITGNKVFSPSLIRPHDSTLFTAYGAGICTGGGGVVRDNIITGLSLSDYSQPTIGQGIVVTNYIIGGVPTLEGHGQAAWVSILGTKRKLNVDISNNRVEGNLYSAILVTGFALDSDAPSLQGDIPVTIVGNRCRSGGHLDPMIAVHNVDGVCIKDNVSTGFYYSHQAVKGYDTVVEFPTGMGISTLNCSNTEITGNTVEVLGGSSAVTSEALTRYAISARISPHLAAAGTGKALQFSVTVDDNKVRSNLFSGGIDVFCHETAEANAPVIAMITGNSIQTAAIDARSLSPAKGGDQPSNPLIWIVPTRYAHQTVGQRTAFANFLGAPSEGTSFWLFNSGLVPSNASYSADVGVASILGNVVGVPAVRGLSLEMSNGTAIVSNNLIKGAGAKICRRTNPYFEAGVDETRVGAGKIRFLDNTLKDGPGLFGYGPNTEIRGNSISVAGFTATASATAYTDIVEPSGYLGDGSTVDFRLTNYAATFSGIFYGDGNQCIYSTVENKNRFPNSRVEFIRDAAAKCIDVSIIDNDVENHGFIGQVLINNPDPYSSGALNKTYAQLDRPFGRCAGIVAQVGQRSLIQGNKIRIRTASNIVHPTAGRPAGGDWTRLKSGGIGILLGNLNMRSNRSPGEAAGRHDYQGDNVPYGRVAVGSGTVVKGNVFESSLKLVACVGNGKEIQIRDNVFHSGGEEGKDGAGYANRGTIYLFNEGFDQPLIPVSRLNQDVAERNAATEGNGISHGKPYLEISLRYYSWPSDALFESGIAEIPAIVHIEGNRLMQDRAPGNRHFDTAFTPSSPGYVGYIYTSFGRCLPHNHLSESFQHDLDPTGLSEDQLTAHQITLSTRPLDNRFFNIMLKPYAHTHNWRQTWVNTIASGGPNTGAGGAGSPITWGKKITATGDGHLWLTGVKHSRASSYQAPDRAWHDNVTDAPSQTNPGIADYSGPMYHGDTGVIVHPTDDGSLTSNHFDGTQEFQLLNHRDQDSDASIGVPGNQRPDSIIAGGYAGDPIDHLELFNDLKYYGGKYPGFAAIMGARDQIEDLWEGWAGAALGGGFKTQGTGEDPTPIGGAIINRYTSLVGSFAQHMDFFAPGLPVGDVLYAYNGTARLALGDTDPQNLTNNIQGSTVGNGSNIVTNLDEYYRPYPTSYSSILPDWMDLDPDEDAES